jgi:hypothetical protein
MAYDWSRLCEITTLAATATTYYTHDTDGGLIKSYVKLIILHNTSGSDVLVNLWVVPDNAGSVGTAADANQIYEQLVPAGRTVDINFEQPGLIMIDDNETIQGMADTASVVTIQIMGATE